MCLADEKIGCMKILRPHKLRIVERNKWMINRADIVVTYVTHITGGAAEFKALAEKKGKMVINVS